MVGIRQTSSRLLLGTALSGAVRLTRSTILLGGAYPGPLLITSTRILLAQTVNRAFYLTRLDSSSTINDFTDETWTTALVAGPIPEFNPYKPQVPESLIDIGGREFFDYIEENQKTLRMQHNLLQAGDTTFPWQMMQTAHKEKLYTLGSITRFYHADYGIILARYVQFDKMNKGLTAASPVGLIANTGKLDWIVSNRLEISNPHLVIGINASFVVPDDKSYGWAIVNGVNLQPLINLSTTHEQGETFVWAASGQVKNEGIGLIIARRLNKSVAPNILAGQAHISIESISRDTIIAALSTFLADVEQLKLDVAELESLVSSTGTLQSLLHTVNQLSARLSLEEKNRKAADNAINNKIALLDFVTDAELASAVTTLQNSITALQSTLTTQLNTTKDIALEALAKANQALAIDLTGLQGQINMILARLNELDARPKGRFPIVDGSVPPNLVYLEDGSLVYTETF